MSSTKTILPPPFYAELAETLTLPGSIEEALQSVPEDMRPTVRPARVVEEE